ncbi:MAG: rhomboid family intramembrane serine protease [Anaerolineales bacterium]|nr:rhomboid family intramembrane serine protease [Anaerolineales bacterium]
MNLPPGAPPSLPLSVRLRPPRHRVWLTYALLAAIGFVFVGQVLTAPRAGDFDPFLAFGAKVNELIAQGQLWRLVTPIFLHGSLLHFFFNAYALYVLGSEMEAAYGAVRFLLLFFFAGITGVVASMLFSPFPSVGASGAIFGLIGAEAVLLYRNRRLLGERARAGLMNIVLIAALNLFIGLSPGSRIDNWGHFGGLLGGLSMAWAIGPVWGFRVLEAYTIFETPVAVVDRNALNVGRWFVIGLLWVGLGVVIVFAISLYR